MCNSLFLEESEERRKCFLSVPFTYTIVKRMIGYKYWRKK